MKLESKASIQIQKPAREVYEAIVDPSKMTHYFISESTGPLETGKEVNWKFPKFSERFPITEVNTQPEHSVSFVWDPETAVNITLEKQPDNSTVVRVTEGEKEPNESNLEWALENSGGWANFLACMKAYYGTEELGWILEVAAYHVSANIVFLKGAEFNPQPPLGSGGESRYVKLSTVEEMEDESIHNFIAQAGKTKGWK